MLDSFTRLFPYMVTPSQRLVQFKHWKHTTCCLSLSLLIYTGNVVNLQSKHFSIGYLFCWKEGSNLKENQLNTPLIVLWWMAFDWIDDICIGVDSSSTPCTPSQEFYSLDQLKRTSLLLQSTFIQIWSKAYLKCWYLNWKIFKENFSMHIWIKVR